MSALSPGLYRATVRGEAGHVVMVDRFSKVHNIDNGGAFELSDITDARPLIVLDLGDDDPHHYIRALCQAEKRNHAYNLALRKIADQIAEQTKPARIPEPNQGTHVEANLLGFPSWNEFFRIGILDEAHWVRLKDGNVYTWDHLTNALVVGS